jgi:hypothetical protein
MQTEGELEFQAKLQLRLILDKWFEDRNHLLVAEQLKTQSE